MTSAQPRSGEDPRVSRPAEPTGEGGNAGRGSPAVASTSPGSEKGDGGHSTSRRLPDVDEEQADRGRRVARDAMDLACMVRDEDPVVVWARLATLSRDDLEALVIGCAAMVPIDRTASDLLDWIDFEPRQVVARKARVATRRAKTSKAEQVLAAGVKWCSPCQTTHPFAEFYSDRTRPDGLSGWCREVTKQRRKQRAAARAGAA